MNVLILAVAAVFQIFLPVVMDDRSPSKGGLAMSSYHRAEERVALLGDEVVMYRGWQVRQQLPGDDWGLRYVPNLWCDSYWHPIRNDRLVDQMHMLALLGLLANYRYGAVTKRRLSWSLTDSELLKIVKQKCSYCGEPPLQMHKQGASEFIYNGIDRVNPEKGYTIKNCVPCCGMCNMGKRDYSKTKFLDWISRVNAHSFK